MTSRSHPILRFYDILHFGTSFASILFIHQGSSRIGDFLSLLEMAEYDSRNGEREDKGEWWRGQIEV
jgi:hypothetical protein